MTDRFVQSVQAAGEWTALLARARREALEAQARRRRRRRALAVLAAVGVLLVVGLLVASGAAAQEPPACPSVPEALPSEPPPDPVVDELRELRRDVAASCAAMKGVTADGLEELTQGLHSVGLADGQVVALDGPVALNLGGSADSPLHVQTPANAVGTVALDEGSQTALVEASAATAGVLHADLWVLLGMCAIALPGYGLFKVLMPRA